MFLQYLFRKNIFWFCFRSTSFERSFITNTCANKFSKQVTLLLIIMKTYAKFMKTSPIYEYQNIYIIVDSCLWVNGDVVFFSKTNFSLTSLLGENPIYLKIKTLYFIRCQLASTHFKKNIHWPLLLQHLTFGCCLVYEH